MTKSFTLHRSNGVRVSPCFQTDGVEGEEEKGLGQELPVGGQRREDSTGYRGGTAGVANRKERRRNVLEREREEHGRRRRLGEKERVGSGAREWNR